MVTVRSGARLHFGFLNLSLARDRLYGGVGLALDEPRVTVTAHPNDRTECPPDVEPYVRSVVGALGIDGATVTVEERVPRHVGLGSGTQIALGALEAVGLATGRSADPRVLAPVLGRAGRSGVGVATFETGGFVVDAGHPTERFTTDPPDTGDWTVPATLARHRVPEDWRFVLVVPETDAAVSGPDEDRRMRRVVERADPGIADEIATVLTGGVLPAVAEGDPNRFGEAAARLGRLNGAWYADEQGGVYRPPAGRVVERLGADPAIAGAGQSSWGPTVWGLTTVDRVEAARAAAERALAAIDAPGSVLVSSPRNRGSAVTG